MIRRFITLMSVAFLSGAAGTAVGILVAPADGAQTRQQVSAFVEQHGDRLTQGLAEGSRMLGDAIEFVTSRLPLDGESG